MNKLLLSIVCTVALTACGESATNNPASAAASMQDLSNPTLHLFATGESGTFQRQPSCMTELVVENRSDSELLIFTADFTPTHAQTGAPLEVVLSMRAMVPHMSPTNPLPAGERGQPAKMNVVGATCEQVQFTLGPVNCSLLGGSCVSASVEQSGLAGISPASMAAPRR